MRKQLNRSRGMVKWFVSLLAIAPTWGFSRYIFRSIQTSTTIKMAVEIYSPIENNEITVDLFKEPIRTDRPPFIYHIKADRDYSHVLECILTETTLPTTLVQQLFSFGAVYALSKETKNIARRVFPHTKCIKDTYVRVHANPQRYPTAWKYDWKRRILVSPTILNNSECREELQMYPLLQEFLQNYVVIDKPSSVPCVSTVDNLLENANYQIDQAENSNHLITSRIDSCTSGLLVFARTSPASAYYHGAMRENRIQKLYKTLTTEPTKVGVYKHLYRKQGSIPGKHRNAKPTLLKEYPTVGYYTDELDPVWVPAELEILNCQPYKISDSSRRRLYESYVKLITGRTHQIRLQFSAIGAPILDDSRYEPVRNLFHSEISDSHGDGSSLFGKEPSQIGLKCAQLRIPLRDDVRQQLPSSSNWKLIINPHCSVSNEYLMLTAPSEWYI